MTILRSGSTKEYASNWGSAFGESKKKVKPAKAGKKSAKASAKKSKKSKKK